MQNKLVESLKTGFIDKSLLSQKEFLPQLLVNDKIGHKKILTTILKELKICEEFWFSVAFATTSGVATLINTLEELKAKGIKGKILVSQYLNFTHPEALKRLLQFENIELKIAVDVAFHSKGYLFKKGQVYDLIIGSSNLTAEALTNNIEWNLKITATPVSHIIFNAIEEFAKNFQSATWVTKDFILKYELLYKKQLESNRWQVHKLLLATDNEIKPNQMQKDALENLKLMRSKGINKALLISATGTGKTFLSAFDALKVKPKKLLFVVHRLNIAEASKTAFERIFKNSKTTGIYSGSKKELDADHVFSTVQTISKDENLLQIDPYLFDYIIIDESHRAGADSYLKILNHFKPKFLLGMTATPERTDGLDIFKLFDHNIAYEIRLHQALEENILSPFHYYGVTDISVNGKPLEENSDFKLLTAIERIKRIIEKANFYGCDDGNVRGLIFCSRIEECIELSKGFNELGLRTIALTGEASENRRADAINELESDDKSKKLDYIFTVDIFNEGVDIPKVNQIIMLRPTQSAIVFVQQLGRGLRKLENKDYLTVIDFIGNYKNNFMVPIALYGDTSYNKDTLRKLVSSESQFIPGTSTINFDRISKDRIFESIDSKNMSLKRDLEKDYKLLKFKLGKIPMMVDFLEHGSRDPMLYVNNSKSYYNFLVNSEETFEGNLTPESSKLLELFSTEINNSKRVEETVIIQKLIENGSFSVLEFKKSIQDKFNYEPTNETIESCLINLNFNFIRVEKSIVELINGEFVQGLDLKKALKEEQFNEFLWDNCQFAYLSFTKSYNETKFINGLILYNKYSRKDVCRILNWQNDISSTVYGYRTQNEITPCFVTYHKSDDISKTTAYNDHFIDQNTFAWESRSQRKIESLEIQNVINSKRILLFVKKEDAEGSDFYYLGDVAIQDGSVKQDKMADNITPVVHFKFLLKSPVEDSIYEYLTSKITDNNIDEQSIESVTQVQTSSPFKILNLNEARPYENCIPLYDIKVAAGNFSDLQQQDNVEWVQLNEPIKYSRDYFICQVFGESMNKVISNGSWCLFKKDPGGTRNGKIVLVYHSSFQDNDFGLGYTTKLYHSEKLVSEEGWQHQTIHLEPKSLDTNYKPIVLHGDELVNLKVLGVFVKVLG